MTTFRSDSTSLPELIKDITTGKIQLPDFQRGWVWDDDHVRNLLVSIARSFPVGAVMLMETGGEVRFQTRPVEGIDPNTVPKDPDYLILDGQQRLTSLTQAVGLASPVDTRTAKGKAIKRHYYFNIRTALEGEGHLEDAVVAVNEERQKLGNFNRDVTLDLSTRQLECEQLFFPCDQIINSDDFEEALQEYAPENFGAYMRFRKEVINAFRSYQLPIIELKKETSKEAVCLVFEKVNTGGVPLSVFQLITATYAADDFNLRKDWLGDEQEVGRKSRLGERSLLKGVTSNEFLLATTLLYTHARKQEDIAEGRTGKQVRPVSAKRASVLDLPLTAYKHWADKVENGFRDAAHFLENECIHSRRELPYTTQLVPLAALMTLLGDRWREHKVLEKLQRWYWCGVLGELYGGAVETRIAADLDEVMQWINDSSIEPRTVSDASFDPGRLDSLKSRQSAAYKGLNILVLRDGAEDFYWKLGVQQMQKQDIPLDIHHIFPRQWCKKQGIPARVYDSVLNKTPISAKANRTIGGHAPSRYLSALQEHKNVQVGNETMDDILRSHKISPETLRSDNFDAFRQERRQRLLILIEHTMGKKPLEGADDMESA